MRESNKLVIYYLLYYVKFREVIVDKSPKGSKKLVIY